MRTHCIGTIAALILLTVIAFVPGCRSRSRLDATLPGAVIHYDGMTVDTAPKAQATPAAPAPTKPAAPAPIIFTPVELAPPAAPAPAGKPSTEPVKGQ